MNNSAFEISSKSLLFLGVLIVGLISSLLILQRLDRAKKEKNYIEKWHHIADSKEIAALKAILSNPYIDSSATEKIHKQVVALQASFDQNYARQNDFFLRASGEWQTISQAYDSQTGKVGELRRSVRKPDQEFGNLIDLVEKGTYEPSLHFAQLKPEESRRSIVVPIYVAKDTLAVFLYQDYNSN